MIQKIVTLLVITLLTNTCLSAVTKDAHEVFKKWNAWQHIMQDVDLTQIRTKPASSVVDNFRAAYENSLYQLNHYRPFLTKITNEQINEFGYQFRNTADDSFLENLGQIQTLVAHNMPEFIAFLKEHGFTKNPDYVKGKILDKNLALTTVLFPTQNKDEAEQVLFSVANKFFEFCFNTHTFPIFQKMLLDPTQHAITKYLYSTIWFHLAGTGWKNWSSNTLDRLEEEAKAGKTIKYIAGGSDVFQMLKRGVYNIRIIDPQLPSQGKYYTNDWAWFTLGNQNPKSMGDQVIYADGETKLVLTRSLYQETGETFKARLANGQVVLLPKSFTIWNITNQSGEQLGSYIFERRFVEQKDFAVTAEEALLISFNELFFICLPDHLNGWGIEPSQFPNDLTIHVKQLHQSINKQTACNIRLGSVLNSTDLQYISLGTCIN